MSRTRIKICGVRSAESALAAAECGADAVGFVFAPASPRLVSFDQAAEIAAYLPPFVQRVGLLVDPSAEEVEALRRSVPVDLVQLHGAEDESLVRACGPAIIKAVRYDPATIEHEIARWNEVAEVDALLIDGSPGGEGRALDWAGLAAVADACHHPLILAGGLTPENVGEAVRTLRPYAVDVSSGVESSRGVKSAALIARFCAAVRAADASAP